VSVFLFAGFQKMGRDEQVAWAVRHFSEIERRAESSKRGTNLLARQNGKIEKL